MKNKRFLTLFICLTLTASSLGVAFAEVSTESPISPTPTEQATTTDAQVTAQPTVTAADSRLANELGTTYGVAVSAQDVAGMHSTGVGYGEISTAYGLAALSGKTVGEVMGMKQSMGWGAIAQSLGVKVSDVTKNEKAMENAVKSAEKSKVKDSKNVKDGTSKSAGATKSVGSKGAASSGGKGAGSNSGGHGGGHGGGK